MQLKMLFSIATCLLTVSAKPSNCMNYTILYETPTPYNQLNANKDLTDIIQGNLNNNMILEKCKYQENPFVKNANIINMHFVKKGCNLSLDINCNFLELNSPKYIWIKITWVVFIISWMLMSIKCFHNKK